METVCDQLENNFYEKSEMENHGIITRGNIELINQGGRRKNHGVGLSSTNPKDEVILPNIGERTGKEEGSQKDGTGKNSPIRLHGNGTKENKPDGCKC